MHITNTSENTIKLVLILRTLQDISIFSKMKNVQTSNIVPKYP